MEVISEKMIRLTKLFTHSVGESSSYVGDFQKNVGVFSNYLGQNFLIVGRNHRILPRMWYINREITLKTNEHTTNFIEKHQNLINNSAVICEEYSTHFILRVKNIHELCIVFLKTNKDAV